MESGASRHDVHPARGTRRSLSACVFLVVLLLWSCRAEPEASSSSAPPQQVFRVLRPKQFTALSVLEKQRTLEKSLLPLGFSVQWLEFAAGPQQLEALGAGALDIASTAESPPIFAQAAGTPIVYLAVVPPSGKAVSLLVPADSPAKSIRDLVGKKIAFQKTSIGHYLLVRALSRAGLTLADVEPVYLAPPDAAAAFTKNAVDAWFIWEPFVTRSVQSGVGRVLFDGESLRDSCNFLTTTRQFATDHPDVLASFLAALQQAEAWSRDNPREMADLLAGSLMIDAPTLLEMHGKYTYGLWPITPAWVDKQQEVADLWATLGLLPQKVDVRSVFLAPAEYTKLGPPPLGATP